MGKRVFVIGVGMTKFEKPGKKEWDYPDMARIAVTRALDDACITFKDIQQAAVGYCYGDSTCGQRALYPLGMGGIPIYNVNNNCATGSTALFMAKQFVEGGVSDCVLALGFEKMERGSLGSKYTDRTNPLDKHVEIMCEYNEDFGTAPPAPWMFGNAARAHMEKYGTTREQVCKIAHKNHKHSVNNPYSQFRDEYTLKQIMESKSVYEPLTKLGCCPTSDGGGAAILASEEFVVRHGLQGQAVELVGMSMATDLPSAIHEPSAMKQVGFDMTRLAATQALSQAGLKPKDVQVVELHDCFAGNELVTYEALQLCEEGGAGRCIDQGYFTYGGGVVVNPSGGLISKGHPLGATGLAQCAEICWQLRGEAALRQVPNARVGLTHNLGLGGAAVVTVYKRPDAWLTLPMKRPVSGGAGFSDDGKPLPAGGAAPAPAAAPAAAAGGGGALKSEVHMANIEAAVKAKGAEFVKKIKGVIRFDLRKPGAVWTLNLKSGTGSFTRSSEGKADLTISVSDDDFALLAAGKLNPQQAFMKGKLKTKGNMGLAMKLGTVLDAARPSAKL